MLTASETMDPGASLSHQHQGTSFECALVTFAVIHLRHPARAPHPLLDLVRFLDRQVKMERDLRRELKDGIHGIAVGAYRLRPVSGHYVRRFSEDPWRRS